jgi:hypothetical protein
VSWSPAAKPLTVLAPALFPGTLNPPAFTALQPADASAPRPVPQNNATAATSVATVASADRSEPTAQAREFLRKAFSLILCRSRASAALRDTFLTIAVIDATN